MKKNRIKRICNFCGNEFFVCPSRRDKYCSKICYIKKRKIMVLDKGNPRWKGGKSRGYILRIAKENWKKKKLPFKCEICGKLKNIMYHHKDKNQKNNYYKNIILVCGSCHSKLHNRIKNIKKMRDKNYNLIKWFTHG